MNIKAIFHGKDPELELKNCVFERVVFLPDEKYQQFKRICWKNTILSACTGTKCTGPAIPFTAFLSRE